MECIVLAGGLGTRLKGVIGALPKCMAPIAGKPFLHYLFQYLAAQKCTKVILSLGFRHEVVLEWLPQNEWTFEIDWVIESEPLGTGGGIKLALQKAKNNTVIILNGDTMFRVDLKGLIQFHNQSKAATTLALKPMVDFDRYGVVQIDEHQKIVQFEEKKPRKYSTINGGIYVVEKKYFEEKIVANRFSFEQDYLEAFVSNHLFYGWVADDYFIDIGIPSDYEKAQIDFSDF